MSTESAVYEIKLKDQFTTPLSGLETKMNRFEGHVSGLQGSVNGLGASIAGAFAGGALIGGIESLISGIKNIAIEAVNTAKEFRNMEEAIAFASGDNAKTNLGFLNRVIVQLGLDVESAYKGFKTFQGGLMGTTLEGEKGLRVFEAVSKAATVMKLSGEQTEGAFLALGQMISKGTVSAEELRGQLGERLPGAFQLAARAMGVTTSQLGEMMKAGEVISEDFLPKFAAELERTFSPGVAKAQNSFNANMNRFKNFVLSAKIALGESLIPTINDLVSVIPRIDFSPLLYTFSQLKTEIAGVFDAFGDLMQIFGVSLSTFDKISIAVRYISFLFRTAWTPIRFTTHLFTQLVTLFKNSVGIFEGVGKVLKGIFLQDFALITKGIDKVGTAWEKLMNDASSKTGAFWNDEKQGWKKIFSPLDDESSKENSWSNGTSGAYGSSAGGGMSGGKTSSAGVEKIQSGTRNITINIKNLIETVKFEKMNGMSEAQLMDRIKRALLTTVNDVNIVAQ